MDCDQRNKDGVDIRQRKYGLPGWMVNNIPERLNHATDFERYGSSPPETESFLQEGMGFSDSHPMDPSGFQEMHHHNHSIHHHSDDLVRTALENNHRHPVFTSPKGGVPSGFECPDSLVSSPDSTPCPTPEPSPVIRRKVSIPHPGDTVLTNPGRWFYFGKLKKAGPHPASANQGACDSVDTPSRGGVKLVISNFDLNAVSPNSW